MVKSTEAQANVGDQQAQANQASMMRVGSTIRRCFHSPRRIRLEFPYSDPRELILDILRYGPDVEVLAPEALRKAVIERIEQALTRSHQEIVGRVTPRQPDCNYSALS